MNNASYMPSFFDEVFEEKLIQTILVDHDFGRQIMEVLDPEYFGKAHMIEMANVLQSYYNMYETFPSGDLIPAILDKEVKDPLTLKMCKNYMKKIQKTPLNGDLEYVKEKSLEFFRLQHILVTIKDEVFTRIEQGAGKIDEIVSIIEKAVNKGTDSDLGYDYTNDDEIRFNEETIETVPTGWDAIDSRTRGGGFGKKRLVTLLAPPGAGKCFAKGTKILMYDGSIKCVEDVRVGDKVMGPDSKPRNVLTLARGQEEMFSIIPVKGDSWICNRSHTLSLVDSSTSKIRNISVEDYLKLAPSTKEKLKQYRAGVEFKHSDVVFSPYVYGLWLGDGHTHQCRITTNDVEIVSYLENYSKGEGYKFTKYPKEDTDACSYAMTTPRGQVNPLWDFFKYSLVDGEKRIYKKYLMSDRNQRLELLAGIIDTDGHLTNNCYEISTKYPGLRDDILFLARSLGFAAYYSVSHNKKHNRDYQRIMISGSGLEKIPVKIKYKAASPRKQKKNALRTGINVESIGNGEYFGFSVDGDHLFLLSDFTVVHNSTLAVNVGAAALKQGKTVVHYTLELDWREIAEKYDACLSGVEINHLSGSKKLVLERLKEKLSSDARLIIKEYPMKGASVQTIKNHLMKLKLRGIIPDEIIVDQGGLLKPAQANKENRHNLSGIWMDMKGLAQTQKVPVITVHQINRSGYNEELITLDLVAECFDIIGHSDVVITLARNLAQKKVGLGKILLGKNRQGEDGIVLAYAIDGSRAMIDVLEMCDEIEEIMEEQKEEAERNSEQSLAAKIEKFRTRKERLAKLQLSKEEDKKKDEE